MVAECSNPSCSVSFRSLKEGRLFRLESDPALGSSKSNRVEYFCLCPCCSSAMTMRLRDDGTVGTVLLPKPVLPPVQFVEPVHLVASGVDVTIIRDWLGHAHLDTTNIYAAANIETQRKALEQVVPRSRNSKPPRWKRDADLLAWLDSL